MDIYQTISITIYIEWALVQPPAYCILFIGSKVWQSIIIFAYFRGHTVKAVCESFQMSKDAGFKVVSHMMPDLPNVGWERDIEQFTVSRMWSWHFLIDVVRQLRSNWITYIYSVFCLDIGQHVEEEKSGWACREIDLAFRAYGRELKPST